MRSRPKAPPEPVLQSGPEIVCHGCKTLTLLDTYKSIRSRLYMFGADGFGVFEKLPFCSRECWDNHETPTKRAVRESWGRCHHGVKEGNQCVNPGTYTCGFNCCKCRACEEHKAMSMVPIGIRTNTIRKRRELDDPVLAAIMAKAR